MAEFTLPKNSKVHKGKHYAAAPAPTACVSERSIATIPITTKIRAPIPTRLISTACGPMVLDVLINIKNEIDPTLTFRRSCREGICGSCAMNIGGRTRSPAQTSRTAGRELPGPAAEHEDIKDLVPDLTDFYAQYASIGPCFAPQESAGGKGAPAERRRTARNSTATMSAFSAPAARRSCPSIGGTATNISAPRCFSSVPLDHGQPRRGEGDRLDDLEDPFKLYRCHTIMNCAQDLPEGAEPRAGHRRDQAPDAGAPGLTRMRRAAIALSVALVCAGPLAVATAGEASSPAPTATGPDAAALERASRLTDAARMGEIFDGLRALAAALPAPANASEVDRADRATRLAVFERVAWRDIADDWRARLASGLSEAQSRAAIAFYEGPAGREMVDCMRRAQDPFALEDCKRHPAGDAPPRSKRSWTRRRAALSSVSPPTRWTR
ncbi:MAG: 2Fe-2S iron-sulfur cluster-binding protein [Paludibaculum sp.]